MDTIRAPDTAAASERFRWAWVGAGVVLGSLLITGFVYLVDPGFQRPEAIGLIATLSVILLGILVGYRSHGETIRETAIAALVLAGLTAVVAVGLLDARLSAGIWLIAPFYAMAMAMVGGWVGEMLQGTLEEAHADEVIDWPWVFVSVIIGFTPSAYIVFIGEALLAPTPGQLLLAFALSFLLTGWIVGVASPGMTMIEPAIAAVLMVVLDAGVVLLWFEAIPLTTQLAGFAGGVGLAYIGGWLGETTQRIRTTRRLARGSSG